MLIHGKALFHGAGGALTWATVTADTDRELQSAKHTDDDDIKEYKDRAGKTMTVAAIDPKENITFDFIPVSGAIANSLAKAKAAVEYPPMLGKITISGFGIAALDGDWMYVGGGSIDAGNEAALKMSLPCRRYDGAVLAVIA